MAPGRTVAALCAAAVLAITPGHAAGTTETAQPGQLVIERISNSGPASFRLDLTVDPGVGARGFLGAVEAQVDPAGRPVLVRPLAMAAINEHREPTLYSHDLTVSTCAVGACDTGHSFGGLTLFVEDSGPTETPTVIVAFLAERADWTFSGSNYRLRRVPPRFRFVTGDEAGGMGVDYLGIGAEAFIGTASAGGGAGGSLAVAAAPCSTSRTGILSRGAGRITLTGGRESVQETCPIEDGLIAESAPRATSWRVRGEVAGDLGLRGARLLVVDLPLG